MLFLEGAVLLNGPENLDLLLGEIHWLDDSLAPDVGASHFSRFWAHESAGSKPVFFEVAAPFVVQNNAANRLFAEEFGVLARAGD